MPFEWKVASGASGGEIGDSGAVDWPSLKGAEWLDEDRRALPKAIAARPYDVVI